MPPSCKLGERLVSFLDLPDHVSLSTVDEVLKASHLVRFCHSWPYYAYTHNAESHLSFSFKQLEWVRL